ncbi:MAG: hypothetical protein E7604_10820 [Ruminococcaceae bacterium]|nr:hypothetical protein [Oscillospiraceae bacterium]
MKKLFSVILAGVILSSLAASVSASYDGAKVADVPKVPSADLIKIDGNMDDAVWADAVKVEINQFNVGEENDTHGTAYMLWGDNTWYLFYDVYDAEIVPPTEDAQNNTPWTTDSVEMFFDFGNEHADLVQQFRVDCDGWLSYYTEGGADSIYGPDAGQFFGDYAVVMDKDGYNVEVAVNLEKWGLKEGDAIGMQLQINDMTAANETSTTAVWNMAQSLGAGSWDADLYDYVVLGGALEVPEEPADEAPADDTAAGTTAPTTADAGIVAAAAVMAVAAGVVLSKKH